MHRLCETSTLSIRIHHAAFSEMPTPFDRNMHTDIEENLPYVISNTERYHGASYMFDREFMANLAERFKDDLVILPSSVHELLFLRKQEVTDIEELVAMVTEINYTHVLPEDVLSNSVYVYDRTVQNIGSFRLKQFEI